MQIISYVIFFYSIFVFGFCRASGYYGLVVTEKNGNFRLAKPYKNDFESDRAMVARCNIGFIMGSLEISVCTITSFNSYYKAAENEKTYVACPISSSSPNSLFQVLPVDSNNEITDAKFCDSGTEVVTDEVMEFCDPKDNCDKDIRLFHYGFKIHTAYLMKGRTQTDKPKYKSWDPDYDLILGLAVYENKVSKKVLAVEYELLSTPVDSWSQRDFLSNYKLIHEGTSEGSMGPATMNNLDSLFGNFGIQNVSLLSNDDNVYKTNGSTNIEVSASLLAPNEHFHIPLWKLTIYHLANRIYIPLKVINTWDKVAKFSRIVAKHLGDLKVRAGITGTMTVNNDGNRSTLSIKVNNKPITLPKYYWYAFEYQKDEKSYGILVILNGNPVEDTEKICNDDVCTTNKWSISNNDFQSGKIYCCPITKENIKNLEVDFLHLKESEIFNLGNWETINKNIERDFTPPLIDVEAID